ncbi:MAG: ABC transporter ATP-binding protein [Pseudomonadota bacterium]|nr:ABC transporter ATP-binding protein [Pseudomonadota bacterium]
MNTPHPAPAPAHGTAALALHDVSAGYPRRPVLHGVSLPAVAPGTLVAVLGPNAVGKSTLLRAIAGLRPAQGHMTLGSTDLAALPSRERLRRVGYLPQALPQPTSLLAYEILSSGLRASRPEWPAAQRQAAIEETMHTLDLAPLALRRLDELSGGQRQMIGLAQVIVRAPDLLLLDEPTSALDLRWQLHLLQAVRALAERRGIVALVALHDLNLALRFCQQALVLGQGRAQAVGAPADVLTAELLAAVWGVQARLERCAHGRPMLLADAALPAPPLPLPPATDAATP